MRAFLAIPLLSPALEEYQGLRGRLVADVPGVRWAPADSPHITLHFFGTVSSHDAERAMDAVRPVLRDRSPLRLGLHGLGSFPSTGPPRVLWCGVDGDVAALGACAHASIEVLEAAGFAVEHRPYRAHCTLGRPRQPWPEHAQERWRQHVHDEPRTALFTADRAILFQSVMGAAGVRHVPVETLPFGSDVTPSPPLTAGAVRDPRCESGTAREPR